MLREVQTPEHELLIQHLRHRRHLAERCQDTGGIADENFLAGVVRIERLLVRRIFRLVIKNLVSRLAALLCNGAFRDCGEETSQL